MNAKPRIFGLLLAAAVPLALTACAPAKKPQKAASVTVEPASRGDIWRGVATDADEEKLARLGEAWTEALGEARVRDRSAVADEGLLLKRDAGLPRPAPTPGSYNCRLVRLGRMTAKAPAFERFKPFFCYVEVENDLLTIVKQTGSERPAGRLWEDDGANRLIFLGSLALADERQVSPYGEDPARDMAGVLERIAPFRWRLVIPWPQGASKLDVYELTPVANQPK